MQNQRHKSALSCRMSCHLEMVGVHLLRSQPVVSVLKHLLKELYHLISFNIIARLSGRVLNSAVLPSEMYLLIQQSHSVD
jgi:hypothetical protein